ncbi:NAD(P)/FAD-dependent oxidoreductase [Niveispirillum fermenti]|uniref:NAD(P)/FAD-dependent oxidoreductase n=1 Tax=Niveispirillum fermenti TaxID=1233113 RepID=UPI003A85A4B6
MQEFEIVIIGAGMGGASMAACLVQAGVPGSGILLAEREAFPGYHTTGRSAALYSVLYGNNTVKALTSASRAFYMQPPAGFADHPLLTHRGCLYIADDDGLGELQEIEAGARRVGETACWLTPQEVVAKVPILRSGAFRHALWEPDAKDIDVHGLHQGYLRQARAGGVTLRTDADLRAVKRQDGGWIVTLGTEKVRASMLVNAAGAWADHVARMAGVPAVGLMPLRRTAMLLDPPSGADIQQWPALINPGGGFYFKPDAGMILASPADETPSPPCDAQADEWDIAVCVDRVQTAADLPVRRVTRSWAGLRSFVADRSPVLGRPSGHPDFFWFAGQGGYGIQMAPALAQVGAAMLTGRPLPSSVTDLGVTAADLSPDRCSGELA